jgi:HAD superfamily hydrolase (TIGR01509 family)
MTTTGRYEAVLFDFGGTLFGHLPEPALLDRAARQLGAVLAEDRIAAVWSDIEHRAMAAEEVALGRDLDAAVWKTRWHHLYGLADELVPGLGDALYEAMHDPWVWVPYADTADVLRNLHDFGIPIGVVSNTGWDIREPFVVRGLDRDVDAWTLSCEAGVAKPDVQLFTLACERLDVEPAATLMVGDNPIADGGAVAAGLTSYVLPSIPPPPEGVRGLGAVCRLVGLNDRRTYQ